MKINQTLKKWLIVTMVGVMTFLSLSQIHTIKDIDVLADETEDSNADKPKNAGVYSESELTAVLPSAFYDARNEVTSDDDKEVERRETLTHNVNEVIKNNFGNIGLFLGQATEVENKWGSSTAPISVDTNDKNDYFASSDLNSYYNFGHAIHHLERTSLTMNSSNMKVSNTLDTLSHSMSALTKLGVRLMRDYDPSPLLFSLYLTEENKQRTQWLDLPRHYSLETEADGNKLVAIVQNNPTLKEAWSLLRRPAIGGSTTLVGSIVIIAVIFLIASGIVMGAFNGRSSGENYRKALVRIVISFVGIPIVAMLLHYGINTFADVVEPDVTQEEQQAQQGIREHLNLADWYATGFAVPTGVELRIVGGKFKFTQDQVERINNYTYTMVTKGPSGQPDSESGNKPDPVAVFDRLVVAGTDLNVHVPVFSEKSGWDGYNVKVVGNTIKENEEKLGTFDVSASRINYMVSRNKGSTSDGVTVVTGAPTNITENAGEHNFYGLSPLAAHNMMRSSFSGGIIAADRSKAPAMSAVAIYAVPEEAGSGLNPIVRFLATMGMVIAAVKGLATIFTTGIGGIIGGTAGTAVGRTAGMGQAIGGGLALVGGVVGMGIIMDLSFILLDEMAVILYDMFVGVTGDASLIEPIREWVNDWPKILSILKGPIVGILNKLAGAITFVVTLITVPKFGKIPITIFGEKMAELPGLFAEKAQMMENRFTGDFRGGSARGSSMGQSITNQSNQMMDSSGKQLAGVGAAGGAVLAMGASKLGESLSNKAEGMKEDSKGTDSLSTKDATDKDNTDDTKAMDTSSVGNNEYNQELAVDETTAVDDEIVDVDENQSSVNSEDELSSEEQIAQDQAIKDKENAKDSQNAEKAETLTKDTKSEMQGGDKESTKDSLTSSNDSETSDTGQGIPLDKDGNPIPKESTEGSGTEQVGTDDSMVPSENQGGLLDADGKAIPHESTEGLHGDASSNDLKSTPDGNMSNEASNRSDSINGVSAPNLSQDFAGNESFKEDNTGIDHINQENKEGGDFSNVNTNDTLNEHAVSDNTLDSESFSNVSVGGRSNGQGSPTGGKGNPSGGTSQTKAPAEKSATERMSKGTPTLTAKNKSVGGGSSGSNKSTSNNKVSKPNTSKGGLGSENVSSRKPAGGMTGGHTNNKSQGKTQTPNKNAPINTQSVNSKSDKGFKMSPDKVLGAVGQGLQSAGGPVTTERATKAAKLAAASIIGGNFQQQAHNELKKAQGGVVGEGVDQTAQKTNHQSQEQQRRNAQRVEEERLLQEELDREYDNNLR